MLRERQGHTDRWDRALLAFGETVADTSLTPMTADEAQEFADRGWTRWVEVTAALRDIESGGQQDPANQRAHGEHRHRRRHHRERARDAPSLPVRYV